jgi:predicted kinase
MARERGVPAAAIVLNVPEALARERNRTRPERRVSAYVVGQQRAALRRAMQRLEAEGFEPVFVLHGAEEIDEAAVERVPFPDAATARPSPGA